MKNKKIKSERTFCPTPSLSSTFKHNFLQRRSSLFPFCMQHSLHCNLCHPLTDAPLQMNSRTVDFSSFVLIFNSRFLPLILHTSDFSFPFLFLSSPFFSFSFHPRSFPQPDTVLNYISFCNDHVPFSSLTLRELVRLLIAPVFLLPFNVTIVRALGGAVSEFVKSLGCSLAKKFEKNFKVFF